MKTNKCTHTNKTIYTTVSEARASIFGFGVRHYDFFTEKRINRRVKKRSQKRVYYCEHCQSYHLTSQEYFTEDYKNKKRR